MDQTTATATATAFENGRRAAGCQDQREGEGEWQQRKQSRAEMERTPHALGFGIAGRVWNHHQGMEEALLSQQYLRTVSCFWRWSVASLP
jgi:hypothetical protein